MPNKAIILTLLILTATVGYAQDASSDGQAMQQLIRQIEELQKRVQLLESQQQSGSKLNGGAAANAPTTEITSATENAAKVPAAIPQTTSTEAERSQHESVLQEIHDLRGIRWQGFGEADYKVLNQKTPELGTYGFVPGSAGSFYTGDFDLFLTSHLNDRTSVLAEIDFIEGDAQRFSVDLRRMLFKYDANDHLRMSFGRYQTGIGYYNWAVRSASWLQTAADRPLIMEFASDGGLLPTQAVGVSVTGSIPLGRLGLNYIAEYGSSDTIRPDINRDGLLNDENNGNHINVGIFSTPDRIPGLRIGGSIYHDQISELVLSAATGEILGTQGNGSDAPPTSARWNQTIVNGHVVYVAHNIELLNEAFLIRHAPIGGGETLDTPAFYSQFSKKLGPIRPFFRYQYINSSPRNVLYNDVGLRYGPSFGARYDLNEYIAFKAQFDRTARRGLPDLSGGHLQLAFTF